ncbi:hypothetical protein SERLA73DRAFT_184654 [Serpula lacrymans var. lacrymans S7.3]|uniref:DUF6533 domain-containing protein n=2 Tax=Serpula lacrymans var. lacrymans TaxID=341189 RepID=F8Q4V4_SERL3|nr:uncharacterized protein SERLADRAFT_472549 [Serpula lacrymans var. lacrymans S7.9]EGN96581.1 hypothetical protein SERLA73DRAFT_184654 [Serpula lacrymans var. lacrymans S7.3]EGO22152.1 hypothetical protein SERLADRAFT_472549 [Serpula lacrymans var. lacrymans S7.9]
MSNADLELTLIALFGARYLAMACYSLIIYDHALTLDREIEHFWCTAWSFSHVLFFLVRYLSLCQIITDMISILSTGLNNAVCIKVYLTGYSLDTILLITVQGMLTLRTWYLFAGRRLIQWLVAAGFAISLIATIPVVVQPVRQLQITTVQIPDVSGCVYDPTLDKLWAAYIPALFIHSMLYCFLVYRVISCRDTMTDTPLLKRFHKEGGFVYLLTAVGILYTLIGSLMPNVPSMFIPATYGSVVLAISTVTTTRLMLRIHSLASQLHVSTTWLLNHAELARSHWRKGANEGELIVEVRVDDMDRFELPRICVSPFAFEMPNSASVAVKVQ